MGLSDSQTGRCLTQRRGSLTRLGLPRFAKNLPHVPFPLPRRTVKSALVDCLLSTQRPSPKFRRVGVRIFTFEACSGFTRVTAHGFANPPNGGYCPRGFGQRIAPLTARVATESNRQLLRRISHPLVLCAFRGALNNPGWMTQPEAMTEAGCSKFSPVVAIAFGCTARRRSRRQGPLSEADR
jgi:hypothetical protein